MLSSPFRSRFGVSFHLDFYAQEEIEQIIARSADLLDISIVPDAIPVIARSSRFTPRVANRLLKRVRDYAQMHESPAITETVAQKALSMLEIDEHGLEETDRKILLAIVQKFDGGPVGLKSIAAALGEEESTVEDVYEPYLMRIGFLARTSKGRVVTKNGLKHLGLAREEPLSF